MIIILLSYEQHLLAQKVLKVLTHCNFPHICINISSGILHAEGRRKIQQTLLVAKNLDLSTTLP